MEEQCRRESAGVKLLALSTSRRRVSNISCKVEEARDGWWGGADTDKAKRAQRCCPGFSVSMRMFFAQFKGGPSLSGGIRLRAVEAANLAPQLRLTAVAAGRVSGGALNPFFFSNVSHFCSILIGI
jgi:hypothetical protein